jgi:hypothetical protein
MSRCTVCDHSFNMRVVNDYLNSGMTSAGISRLLAENNIDINAEIIARHKRHWVATRQPYQGENRKDFAIKVRDKAYEMFEQGTLDLAQRNHAAGITAGLKAQGLLDKREEKKSAEASAGLAFAIIHMLTGQQPEPLALDDGRTIDGEAIDVTDDTD